MPTLIEFRRRIRSVKNTQQITRAMKFVAAARLRRAQERALAARPYAREILRVLRSAMARVENPTHPLMAERPEERLLALVLTGDRGLCGAFNATVLRKTQEFLHEHGAQELEVLPIGKKGRDTLRKQRLKFAGEYVNVMTRVEFTKAKEVADVILRRYCGAELDAVYVIYNEFKSVLTQKLTVAKLLPIAAEELGAPAHATTAVPVDYLYEQPPAEIFSRLLPRYLETEVFRAMLESSAAEHAARMTAMDSATNNAIELIDQLTLYMNKVRQAAITKEIIEVVSGAASTA